MKLLALIASSLVLFLPPAAHAKPPVRQVGYGQIRYQGHGPEWWHWRYVQLHERVREQWRPTVNYSLRLAAAVSGVSYWELRSVATCESTLNPLAANGRYKGLFQLGWAPFGMSPFDPVAAALSTAFTVRREGWRQWECKP